MKEKNPKWEIEDEILNPTNEDSMKKVKKKGSKSNISYLRKLFHPKNKCFMKNMGIMSHLLEKHNIEVPDELENLVHSFQHCHSTQFQGHINYALSSRVKSFFNFYDIDSFSDI